MKRIQLVVLALAVMIGAGVTFCGCKSGHAASDHKTVMTQAVYVCPACHMMAMQPGKCMCGQVLAEKHLLGMKDGKALVCDCAAGCKCNMAGMKDGKCACGKPIEEVSAKGMYTCACAGGKCCHMISDKPGKCACGADMKKME